MVFDSGFTADAQILAEIARLLTQSGCAAVSLSFAITVSPDGGPITLDLAGPPARASF
jgi:hypothetical protein